MNKYDYEVQGLYWNGWEPVYTAASKKEALEILADYRSNDPGSFRIARVKVEA